MTAHKFWRITYGRSVARVRADDYEGALARARQFGIKNPDSVVLITADWPQEFAQPLKPVQTTQDQRSPA